MIQKVKNKLQKGAIDLAVAVVAAIAIFVIVSAGFVVWSNRSKTINVTVDELPVLEPGDESFGVLNKIIHFLTQQTGLTSIEGNLPLFWRVPVGNGRPVTDYVTINAPAALDYQYSVDLSTDFTKSASKQVLRTIEQTFNLVPLAVKAFEHNQFIPDSLNTYADNDEGIEVKSYTRGKVKCSIIEPADNVDSESVTISINCISGDEFDRSYQEQFPILKDLFEQDYPKGWWKGAWIGSGIVRSGDFLRISAQGGYNVLKLEGGRYQWLFGGQDIQLCGTVDKLNVPKEIYGNCFEKVGPGEDDYKERFSDAQLKLHYLNYPED